MKAKKYIIKKVWKYFNKKGDQWVEGSIGDHDHLCGLSKLTPDSEAPTWPQAYGIVARGMDQPLLYLLRDLEDEQLCPGGGWAFNSQPPAPEADRKYEYWREIWKWDAKGLTCSYSEREKGRSELYYTTFVADRDWLHFHLNECLPLWANLDNNFNLSIDEKLARQEFLEDLDNSRRLDG
jgi:hypothetical protein